MDGKGLVAGSGWHRACSLPWPLALEVEPQQAVGTSWDARDIAGGPALGHGNARPGSSFLTPVVPGQAR